MHHIKWITLCCLFLGLSACGDTAERPSFDRSAMLDQLAENHIRRHLELYQAAVLQFDQRVQSLIATPTEEQYLAVQEEWKALNRAWQAINIFDIGPIASQFLQHPLHRPPFDQELMDQFLASEDILDQEFVNKKMGSSTTGMMALEYLIFTADQDPSILEKKHQLTGLLSAKLKADSQTFDAAWQSYLPTFKTAAGYGINSSLNQMVNAQISNMEFLITAMVGNPLGKSNGGVAHAEAAYERYAHDDLMALKSALLAHQSLFDFSATEGNGLNSYLIFLNAIADNQPLGQVIDGQFNLVIQHIDGLDQPLHLAIEQSPEAVESLYQEMKVLLILLKVDLTHHLSITSTFDDNDGD